MQINRLFQIVYCLLSNDTVSAGKFAERFGVSVRTIYRDVDVLSSVGIPVYYKKGKNGGISLLENFTLNKSILSSEEKRQIMLGLSALGVTGNVNGEKLSLKMADFLGCDKLNQLEVDYTRAWSPNDKSVFKNLSKALVSNSLVKFDYYSMTGATKERIVEPIKLSFMSRSWYLKAFCRWKDDFRLFKLSRIRNLSLLNESYTPKEFPCYGNELYTHDTEVILECSKDIAYRIYDEFDEKSIIETDGKIIVKFFIQQDDWLYSFLLSLGAGVKIISPVSIKQKYIKLLEQIMSLY